MSHLYYDYCICDDTSHNGGFMENIEKEKYCDSCRHFERLYWLTTNGFQPSYFGTCSMCLKRRVFHFKSDICDSFRQEPLSEEKRNAIIQTKNTIANFEQTLYRLLKYIDELDKRIDKDN